MVTGRISFIGAGPGAADLITVRGAKRIAEADIVVWAASLVTPECVTEHARSDAELVDSSRLTHEQALEIYRRAEQDKLNVARVHSGDPSLWGAVQEQYDSCVKLNVEVEIVPGVAAFSAAAAAVGRELTVPEVAQSLVLTRLEGGKTPMPDGEKVREFAKHGTTMALFLSAARTGQLVEELRAGGYEDDTPVLVSYKVTWPDELMVRTTLGELEADVKKHKLWRHTLFIIGRALTAGGTRSHLYHAGHFHTFRKADKTARRALRAERAEKAQSSEKSDSEEGEPRKPKESDAAWWAVRDWQETARGAARFGASRTIPIEQGESQPQLFGEQGAEAVQTAAEPVSPDGETTEAPTEVVQSDSGQENESSATATKSAPNRSKASAQRKSSTSSKSSSSKRKAPAKSASTSKSKSTTERKSAAQPDEQSE